MTDHAVVIAGGGPARMMLAGELALAGVDIAIVERRPGQDLTGSRAGGLHARGASPVVGSMKHGMDRQHDHLAAIRQLFTGAEARGMPLWLESGWAIDARLGRITRIHEDIDVAYPAEHEVAYLQLLRELGFGPRHEESYGFLCRRGPVLLDCEPCFRREDTYGFPGFPDGSCPLDREGMLDGFAVRCLSWEAMYHEFLLYAQEVPAAQWRAKDALSLRIVASHIDAGPRRRLEAAAGLPPGTVLTIHP